MIINEKLQKNLTELKQYINLIASNKNITDSQLESFLINFEKTRYNILNEIKIYNKTVSFEYEKIKNVDDNYTVELTKNKILKIYIPEVLPSYKNLKLHSHKRILLNIAEITKDYKNLFQEPVFIYIKIFDKILNWDIDNKFVKPIADALVLNQVIEDDNITKMMYSVKGEFSENPHTEVYICNFEKIDNFLNNIFSQNM